MLIPRIPSLAAGGLIAFTLFAAPALPAQEAATQIISSTGTVSQVTPGSQVIQSTTEPEPLRYRFTRTTTYVDETGAPVTLDVVRSGLPVRVEYARSGEDLIATRVIVQRQTVPAGPT